MAVLRFLFVPTAEIFGLHSVLNLSNYVVTSASSVSTVQSYSGTMSDVIFQKNAISGQILTQDERSALAAIEFSFEAGSMQQRQACRTMWVIRMIAAVILGPYSAVVRGGFDLSRRPIRTEKSGKNLSRQRRRAVHCDDP